MAPHDDENASLIRRLLAAPSNPLLRWNTPLSEEHAGLLVRACALPPGGRALDLGCGWGELLMRVVDSAPGATGDGVDTDEDALARGERLAGERGLDERVRFHRSPAAEWAGQGYDVVLCVGSAHAWPGSTDEALKAVRAALRPGGVALYGDGFWAREPDTAALEGLGAERDEFGSLAGLVRRAGAAGLRPLQVTVADEREWDLFESHSQPGRAEQWARQNPGHPLRAKVLAHADRRREDYLGGYRGVLGLAYLVLGG
ncbi:cyclopropane-fatty-acyl-phospholipid synthase family protein [Streptomyces sp. GC420]|uniref:SAM-dependent methyltransferase n=1 Tax=Streptomyces sp. GC420 TaxID=2697568 RepID=UPI001414F77B|nr:class I SAM-dependent methyltransferase [Streptomyces sp. GC420]NBM19396.1 methyltransferase [Streptomyces sp. GC420]